MNQLNNIKQLKEQNLILFEVLAGSHAYGLNTPESDEDIRGVFYLPLEYRLRGQKIETISDKTNDIVYYELEFFLQRVARGTPNMLEMLYSPERCILYQHPVMDLILPVRERFVTTKLRHTFGSYAVSQIKKSRSTAKKIVNPQPEIRKSPLDFCYVIQDHHSYPLLSFLNIHGYTEDRLGVVNISNCPGVMALFVDATPDKSLGYKGLVSNDSSQLLLSSVPADQKPVVIISYNQNQYEIHCREHKEYWHWVNNRNEKRYVTSEQIEADYDLKNMMHCTRVMFMAQEIAKNGQVQVERIKDKEYLLSIRKGQVSYEELLQQAETIADSLDQLYGNSDLPTEVDKNWLSQLQFDMLAQIYNLKN